METKINIAEILRNKPEGTKLYSPIFGECVFRYIKDETNDICVKTLYGEIRFFNFEGLYNEGGECLLFPSKEMRDWSKFAWKRGDILAGNEGWEVMVIFDKWYDDTYTNFYCKHYFNYEDKNHPAYYSEFLCSTVKYSFKNNQYANHDYLKAIEEKLGGKLNRETLEIEKVQPEFKDGDILVTDTVPYTCYSKCIFILKGDLNTDESHANSYVFYNINNNHVSFNIVDRTIRDRNIHLATEEEKQQLFDALFAKKGKYWDAEKKEVVDLKPKDGLKPFDKVLVRDYDNEIWRANLFSNYMSEGSYGCVCSAYKQCVPYEGNEHLLGTRNKVKN